MIQSYEGLRLDAYQDIVGVWTIGYGHTGPEVVPGLRITKEQASAWLTDRLQNEFEPALNTLVGDAPTTQGQFDAMASLEYNIGCGNVHHRDGSKGLAGSSVMREHVAGNYDAAADDFLKFDMAGGREIEALAGRRQAEGQMYLDASPD